LSTAGEAYEELLDEHRRNNVSPTQQRTEEDACVEIRCTVMSNRLADIASAQSNLVRFPWCLPVWFVAVITFVIDGSSCDSFSERTRLHVTRDSLAEAGS
jgi:hypothetical protein